MRLHKPYSLPEGVYYHKTNGNIEIKRSSSNNNDYDGVVVSDGTHQFMIGRHDIDENGNNIATGIGTTYCGLTDIDLSQYGIPVIDANYEQVSPSPGVMDFIYDITEAITVFDGYEATSRLTSSEINAIQDPEYSSVYGCPPARACVAAGGYLGSTGEWWIVRNHLD